jgi:hypothetical protein
MPADETDNVDSFGPELWPQLWIDARRSASGWRLWGMNLVERQIREAARRGFSVVHVWTSPASDGAVRDLRRDLPKLYQVQVLFPSLSLESALAAAPAAVLLLDGDVVYDERVLAYLLDAGAGHMVRSEGVVAAMISADHARDLGLALAHQDAARQSSIGELLDQRSRDLGLAVVGPGELDQYVASLRLTMPPFLARLTDIRQLSSVDRLMYRRTFKGVIDAVALYGYFHLVRWITRHLTRTSLTPNMLTVLSILGVWAAIPCFASGAHAWGMALAWCGVILDSVDGKLARLRLHLSDAMGNFEHWAAMPGLGLWYLAMGWSFSGESLFTTEPIALATWALIGAYLIDKVLSGGFKALYKRELFDYGPIDATFHLVACRRNTSLLIFTAGLPLRVAEEAFYGMAVWMMVTLLFHATRFAWIALTDGSGLRVVAGDSRLSSQAAGS